MRALENRIPPPLVALMFSFIMWWLSAFSVASDYSDIVRVSLVSLIVMVGAFFCLSGVVSFRRARTTVNPLQPEKASSLVCSGIYRFSRNPMYVGFALFLVSLAIYLSSPLSMLGVMGFILYMNEYQIKPEERVLTEIFGSEFVSYTSAVRRWL